MRLKTTAVIVKKEAIDMASAKINNVTIELHDGIGFVDALQILQEAMKEIDTKVEVLDGNMLEWDLSKHTPGYSVKMRDEGIGKPHKFVVGKAPRVRQAKAG